jgi:predicted aconitase
MSFFIFIIYIASLLGAKANPNGTFMEYFMTLIINVTSPILLMCQYIYEEREERVSSYVREVSSP